MKKNNQKLIIITGIIMILSFIIFYVGQFLFLRNADNDNTKADTGESSAPAKEAQKQPSPVEYKHIAANISGFKQEIFTLEFNPSDERVEFKPVLSYDNIFGFERIAEIIKRTGAYAAINAGFFFEFGDPAGMVAIDGNLLTASTGYNPVLIVDNNGASFKTIKSELSFTYNKTKETINTINRLPQNDTIMLYTSDFGSTNRAKINNTSVRIENNVVTEIFKFSKEVKLKKGSYLISFFGKKALLADQLGIKKGDKLNIGIKPNIKGKYSAYECGSMLVVGGKPVIKDRDIWVGTLNNRDPRTAVGVKENGNILLLVVDGRQPGYSTGFTGKELAQYLISIGVKDAAMLDGGATSQMFVNGRLVNKPSDRGIERPVGGTFIVKVNEE